MSLYIGNNKVAPIITVEKKVVELEVNPSTSEQTILPPSDDVAGFSPVKVNAVTSDIDSNIKPENIRLGVTILGVTGSYTGS